MAKTGHSLLISDLLIAGDVGRGSRRRACRRCPLDDLLLVMLSTLEAETRAKAVP